MQKNDEGGKHAIFVTIILSELEVRAYFILLRRPVCKQIALLKSIIFCTKYLFNTKNVIYVYVFVKLSAFNVILLIN